MLQILINNQIIDLSGSESIEADYSIFDISKIGSRTGARTYSFTVPKTNRNRTVLDSPEVINNLSSVPYTRLPCLVLVDGIDVQIRFCEIESVKEGYNLRLYGGNSDLFATLKEVKCSDLDLSAYDHYWNLETIVASLGNTEGYIYGLIDYHLDSPNSFINNDNRVVRADYILPSVFYNTVLNLIFAGTDYTLINDVEEDTENLVLPFHKELIRDTQGTRYEATLSSSDTFAILDVANGGPTALSFQSVVSQGANYFVAPMTADEIYFADEVSLRATLTLSITSIDAPGVYNDCILSYGYTNRDTIGGGGVGTGQVTFSVGGGTAEYEIEIDFTLKQALTDGYVYLEFFLVAPFGLNGVFTLNAGTTIEFSNVVIDKPLGFVYDPVVPNTFDYITPASIIPDVTQMDLVKAYLQMFGLLPIVNDVAKTVRLVEFDTILANIGSAYDWSELVDFTEDYELKFVFDEYGQRNYFRYKQDSDEEKVLGTDGSILINNTNLELEKEVVELIFAGTRGVQRCVNNGVSQIGIFENGEYSSEREPRVLNVLRKSNADFGGDLILKDTVDTETYSGVVPLPYFILGGEDFNLGFGNNLLANYYELLTNVLSRAKILKVNVRLSAADVSVLDFSIPVYIAAFESFFYISSIKGFSYTESRSTEVELVKLNIHG